MKFFLTLSFLFLSSVGILYYLITNSNFLPINSIGEYNWVNISAFILLLIAVVFSIITFIVYLVLHIFKKEFTFHQKSLLSIKISLFITFGLLIVFSLNFFHILDIIWGLLILFIVLIALIVI
jgi:hypothetical protein